MRRHGPSVRACRSDEKDISLVRVDKVSSMTQDVAGLTDRSDHVHFDHRAVPVQACQVHDFVPCPVECGTDQRVHAGVDAHVGLGTLGLSLGDRREEHSGLCDEVAPGFEPDLEFGMVRADGGQRGIDGSEIKGGLSGFLGYAQPAAEIEDTDMGEAGSDSCQEAGGPRPCVGVPDPAPDMRVKSDDPAVRRVRKAFEMVHLVDRDAKLRARAACPHMGMVSVTVSGIDADEDLAPREESGPVFQGMQFVECDDRPEFEALGLLCTRCEVRREQDRSIAVCICENASGTCDLGNRYALESEADVADAGHERPVRIGLHGVEDA